MSYQAFRGLFLAISLLVSTVLISAVSVQAQPYAEMVVDARTGEVLRSRNADTRLHPASLTKMMTLYVIFDAVERGEISLDKMVTISRKAANEQPSKLGLRAGQKIKLRYLIRGAAVKSANDAATALGEALSGSEAAFARRMTRTARQLGMTRSTFKNAHGLTARGHLSTARDMTLLGRRLFYDFPQYYNLFSRQTTDAGVRKVLNTNRKLLKAYRGADGIKTGFTNAAGFNLVASAERGNKRIIATVFGGRTSAARNKRVAELLDLGFSRAPNRVAVRKPKPVNLGVQPKTIRVAGATVTAVKSSRRPAPRRAATSLTRVAVVDMQEIQDAVALVNQTPAEFPRTGIQAKTIRPPQRAAAPGQESIAVAPAVVPPAAKPATQPAQQVVALTVAPPPPRVITRVSTAGGRLWAVQIGAVNTRYQAEKMLLRTALANISTLATGLRKVDYVSVKGYKKYRARFVGLSQADAKKTCARLQARDEVCSAIAPGG
jgi:D-alanyl-D-alanine carboxypeptidase